MDRDRNRLLNYSAYLNSILLLSVVYLVVAGLSYYNAMKDDESNTVNSSLMERNLAIERARESGNSSYQFETGFAPGLGMISDTNNE